MNSASLPNISIKISNHNKTPHWFRLTIHPTVVWPTEDRYRYFGKSIKNKPYLKCMLVSPLLPTPCVQYSTWHFIYNFIPLLPHTVLSLSSFLLSSFPRVSQITFRLHHLSVLLTSQVLVYLTVQPAVMCLSWGCISNLIPLLKVFILYLLAVICSKGASYMLEGILRVFTVFKASG